MIRTIADLLGQFLEIERRTLDEVKITHRPTIGGMYEQLSREVLDRTLPCDGLSVSSGFIENSEGKQGAELDCILVRGGRARRSRIARSASTRLTRSSPSFRSRSSYTRTTSRRGSRTSAAS